MVSSLVAIAFMTVLAVIESTLTNHLHILQGNADLVLLVLMAWALHKRVQSAWQWGIIAGLVMGIYSALPFGTLLAGYLLSIGITLLLRRRVWQAPILAMVIAVFTGTLVTHAASFVALKLVGNPIQLADALNLVTLPSLILNLIFMLPAYGLMNEMATWLYPQKIEI